MSNSSSFTIFGPGERPSRGNSKSNGGARDGAGSGGGFARRRMGMDVEPVSAERIELEHMRHQLGALQDEPLAVAQVVEVRGDRMIVSMGQNVIDINRIEGAEVGSRVRLHRQSSQAIDVIAETASGASGAAGLDESGEPDASHASCPVGSIVIVMRSEHGIVEAEVMNVLRSFRCGIEGLQKGERVVVDPSLTYVIGSLGMPPQTFAHAPTVNVSWDDIGGHAQAKAALREALELPFSHPTLFAAYGKRNVAGVILEGASGTGKTLLAKAAATAIAKAHGKSAAAGGFVYVKGPELLNAYIGRTEEAIRRLFSSAREHKKQHGYPAVIFLDECDAILGVRDHTSKLSINATTVPQFLAEMDGLDDRATMLILATNRADMLDPAVTREGRIDRRVHVGRPSEIDACEIAKIHLRARPLWAITSEDMAIYVAASIFDPARVVEYIDDTHTLLLSNFVSGAMIAGVIEQATTAAMMRDIGAGAAHASGIAATDIDWSIDQTIMSLAHTNRNEVIQELIAHERQIGITKG